VNDAGLAGLAGLVEPALRSGLGDARVRPGVTLMAAEDFSLYSRAGVPILMMSVGAANPEALVTAALELFGAKEGLPAR